MDEGKSQIELNLKFTRLSSTIQKLYSRIEPLFTEVIDNLFYRLVGLSTDRIAAKKMCNILIGNVLMLSKRK